MNVRDLVFVRKSDFVILSAGLLTCLLLWLLPIQRHGSFAEIRMGNQVLASVSLQTDRDAFAVAGADGFLFAVRDGAFYVEAAPCINQICVHTMGISHAGQQILCVPAGLYVRICSDAAMPDAVL